MVSSYPLPEGFSDFDVFSLGSCLLVEGECFHFALSNLVYGGCDPLRYANLRLDLTLPRSLTAMLWWENIRTFPNQVNFAYSQAFKHAFCLKRCKNCCIWRIKYRCARRFLVVASSYLHSQFYFCSHKVCWVSF